MARRIYEERGECRGNGGADEGIPLKKEIVPEQ